MLLLSIIVQGCIYALLGAGFVIVYRASRILNFAHAEIVVLAAYFAGSVFRIMGSETLAALVVLAVSFACGLIIYGLFIRPLAGYSVLSSIILTVAIGIVLKAITVYGWKGEMTTIPFSWQAYYPLPGGVRIASVEIVAVVIVTMFFLAMGAFYFISKTGQQMRALAERPLLAAQRGIKIYLISGFAWGLGFLAAGLAAILLGINYTISLQTGGVAIAAFTVALVGGLDSLLGSIFAAFIIAGLEQLATTYVNARLGVTVPYIVLLIVLILKPWGLFGTEEEIERV